MIGIILAGGKSQRFGEDKATYIDPLENKSWVQLMIEKMIPLNLSQIYIAASQRNQSAIQKICTDFLPKEQVLTDQEPFVQVGPLGGLYSVSKAVGKSADYLILPTDYPTLESSTLKKLSQSGGNYYAKDMSGREHYTIASISFSPEEITYSLNRGNRRLLRFYQELGASPFLIPIHELHNYNRKP